MSGNSYRVPSIMDVTLAPILASRRGGTPGIFRSCTFYRRSAGDFSVAFALLVSAQPFSNSENAVTFRVRDADPRSRVVREFGEFPQPWEPQS